MPEKPASVRMFLGQVKKDVFLDSEKNRNLK